MTSIAEERQTIPKKLNTEEARIRLRMVSRVLRVTFRRASTLRWLKYVKSSWASSSSVSISFFFFRVKGEDNPAEIWLAVCEDPKGSNFPSSSAVGDSNQ